jgi:hypothetical protein
MNITYILLLLVTTNPVPTFQMLAEFPNKAECQHVIETLDAPPAAKEQLVCQGFVISDAPGYKEPAKQPKAAPQQPKKKHVLEV